MVQNGGRFYGLLIYSLVTPRQSEVPSTHILFVYKIECRLFRTSKVTREELKFHDVFSALRYRHDICPETLLSFRQASIWRQIYQLITLPS